MNGVIKHYSGKSKYGFITANGQDYFFLVTDFMTKKSGYCRVGNKVSFLPTMSSKGLRATLITLV